MRPQIISIAGYSANPSPAYVNWMNPCLPKQAVDIADTAPLIGFMLQDATAIAAKLRKKTEPDGDKFHLKTETSESIGKEVAARLAFGAIIMSRDKNDARAM